MKIFTIIITVILVFGMAMAIISAVNDDGKRYDPLVHLSHVVVEFADVPSFEGLKQFTQNKSFKVSESQLWRFYPFVTMIEINGQKVPEVVDGMVEVLPDYFIDQDWLAFEWFNQPLGYIVGVALRTNGVVMWLTDWVVAFFSCVDSLNPVNGLVEGG